MSKVSIVDFVHALFKSSVVDICKRDGEYLLGLRVSSSTGYADGRDIVYSFNASGLSTFSQVLERLGKATAQGRPYFKEGDKEIIAQAILDEIKKKHPNWPEFLDDRIEFKKGGKGYVQ